MALSKEDPCSFSNTSDVVVQNIHLELLVDFTKSVLIGHVTLDIEKLNSEAQILVILIFAHCLSLSICFIARSYSD